MDVCVCVGFVYAPAASVSGSVRMLAARVYTKRKRFRRPSENPLLLHFL